MSVIFIFIDGVGVGKRAPENPLSNNGWDSFSLYTGSDGLDASCKTLYKSSLMYKPIDATLGVFGLPQSGTGQTTLFSGVNASKIAGKHFGPFPYSTTRYLLEKESLFDKVTEIGMKPVFMNAYPKIFLKKARKKNDGQPLHSWQNQPVYPLNRRKMFWKDQRSRQRLHKIYGENTSD
ncbi:hypothetical protein BH23BAC3_BH23BAC3_21150 [soil metagenome]